MTSVSGFAALVSLASASLAQPELRFEVVGSISRVWTDKPWPNVHGHRFVAFPALDVVPPGRVFIGDWETAWLFQNGEVSIHRAAGTPIEGLTDAVWSTASDWPSYLPDSTGNYIVNNAPTSLGSLVLRSNDNGFTRCLSTIATNSRGESIGFPEFEYGYGIGPAGGPYVTIYNSSRFVGLPDLQMHLIVPVDAGEDGKMWFAGDGFLSGQGYRRMLVSARESQGAAVIEFIDGQPAPSIGVVTRINEFGENFLADTNDGSIVLKARVRPNGSPNDVHGVWRVKPDGTWSLVYPYNTQSTAFPEGVFIQNDLGKMVGTTRDGMLANLVFLTGDGVTPDNNQAVVTWTEATGLQILARKGDPIPGDPQGRRFEWFTHLHLSRRGDLAFLYRNEIFLYHPAVGVASVARTTRHVADGIATDEHPLRLLTGYGPDFLANWYRSFTGPNTTRNWIDDEGRLYFAAESVSHLVIYTAQLTLPCPGDFNRDGFADFFDYLDFLACYEAEQCPSGRTADINNDGFVDFFDYAAYAESFETGC
jgi:hypothetical protein